MAGGIGGLSMRQQETLQRVEQEALARVQRTEEREQASVKKSVEETGENQRLQESARERESTREGVHHGEDVTKAHEVHLTPEGEIAKLSSRVEQGRDLTGSEMSYLRENDSSLYDRAQRIQEELKEEQTAEIRKSGIV